MSETLRSTKSAIQAEQKSSSNNTVDYADSVNSNSSSPSSFLESYGTNAGVTVLVSPAGPTVETVVLDADSTVCDDSTVVLVPPTVDSASDSAADDLADTAELDPYAEGCKWHYAEKVEGRIFEITTDWVHPDTGEVIITPEKIKEVVARKGNDRRAWVNHDKDVYTSDDVAENPRAVLGQPKPAHVHAVEERRNQTLLSAVARAYSLPPNFIKVRKGHGAFMGRVEYLTHESPSQQALGKHLYDDSEIHANFPFREELNKRVAKRGSGGRANSAGGKQTPIDNLAMRIQEEGLTLRKARESDPLSFNRAKRRMVDSRATFLKSAPMPSFRTNYYFGGPARTGKSTLGLMFAHALAAMLYPDLAPEEAVYVVGRKGVEFQEYDGQPILVWDDFRVWSLIEAFGGSRDALWPAFDISPKPIDVNRKYGSVRLRSAVNIITGVQPYMEFLDNLAGEYTDKNGVRHESEDRDQAYGRVPFVTEVTADTIRFYLNKGFSGNGGYQEYQQFATLRANMRTVSVALESISDEAEKEQVRLATGQRMLSAMIEAHQNLKPPTTLTGAEALAQIETATVVLTGTAMDDFETSLAIDAAASAEEAGLMAAQEWGNSRYVEHFREAHLHGLATPKPGFNCGGCTDATQPLAVL